MSLSKTAVIAALVAAAGLAGQVVVVGTGGFHSPVEMRAPRDITGSSLDRLGEATRVAADKYVYSSYFGLDPFAWTLLEFDATGKDLTLVRERPVYSTHWHERPEQKVSGFG